MERTKDRVVSDFVKYWIIVFLTFMLPFCEWKQWGLINAVLRRLRWSFRLDSKAIKSVTGDFILLHVNVQGQITTTGRIRQHEVICCLGLYEHVWNGIYETEEGGEWMLCTVLRVYTCKKITKSNQQNNFIHLASQINTEKIW